MADRPEGSGDQDIEQPRAEAEPVDCKQTLHSADCTPPAPPAPAAAGRLAIIAAGT
jgi:hypothetical protein